MEIHPSVAIKREGSFDALITLINKKNQDKYLLKNIISINNLL
jgi:hypothetical protein